MNPLYAIYTAMTSGLFFSCFPAFVLYSRLRSRPHEGMRERLGYVPPSIVCRLPDAPRIWIHAVSLGEVNVAASIIRSLAGTVPGGSTILSTTTEHGRRSAHRILGKTAPVIYAPLDTLFAVRKALDRVRPRAMIFLETEIWPTWLHEARRRGAATALLNGRISVRSIGRYLRLRPFFKETLRNVHAFSMISQGDADRIVSLGADPRRVTVNGNAKYDLPAGQVESAAEAEVRRIMKLGDSTPVLVAGSTRKGEEALVLAAYREICKDFPKTLLILAPRHIRRSADICRLLERMGLGYHLWSSLVSGAARRSESVVILDLFGELFKIYSVATVAFCGASLVPLGGQNPLEPASLGKVVLYGPSMEDFVEPAELLRGIGAGITVYNPSGLAEEVVRLLRRPDIREGLGAKAKQALMEHRGAAERHTRIIAGLLSP
jgi:3-deoxy-D-manno-octulosonic-acid transferase